MPYPIYRQADKTLTAGEDQCPVYYVCETDQEKTASEVLIDPCPADTVTENTTN
jgi:hypothetical protein